MGIAELLYRSSAKILHLDQVNPFSERDLANHVERFRPCLDQINNYLKDNQIDNLRAVLTHVNSITAAESRNARLELIRKPASNHFPDCHADFAETVDNTMHVADLENWNRTLSNVDIEWISRDLKENLESVTNNVSLSKLDCLNNLKIDHNTLEYSRVVNRIADTFGADGATEAFKLYELAHKVSEVFLFTCLEHKFVIVLGVGTFSRWVYEWCIHHDGFKTLMRSVSQDIHARFVPLKAKISNVIYNLRTPLVLSGASILSYYCLPLFKKLNSGFLLRTQPILQTMKNHIYDISYSLGALFKAARVGFCDGAFEDILKYLEKVLSNLAFKKK